MSIMLILIVVAGVILSVVGVGVAALVYFLTRSKGGREADPDE
jgi:flagellar basal body-associated protein FliL